MFVKQILTASVHTKRSLARTGDTEFLDWINGNGQRTQVTKTYYDEPNSAIAANLPNNFTQQHLRKRVACVTYEDVFDNDDETYQHATHYTYDIHGNVNTLLQDNPQISISGQRFKRFDYSYDLISGNVKEVAYQKAEPDQWYHRYEYDADNRITHVYTSKDHIIWDRDLRYFYYKHGPLARVEYGDNQVQATDYAYTLQGWIKGINSDALSPERDMGNDGLQANNNTNSYFAQDAASYSLTYYQNDYKPIDLLNRWSNMQDRFIAGMSGSNVLADRHDLFNGNISAMVSTIQPPATANTGPLPQATAYKYDQLNRLITAQAWQNLDVNNNEWESNGNNNNMYLNTFTYDANGNITSQIRNDNSGNTIDELSYHYPQINNKTVKNRLRHVTDIVNDTTFNDDIDNQSADNYLYTEIGELKSDAQEEIDEIVWTASGKIKEINRIVNSSKKNLKFDYDAMGNRVAKHTYNSSNQWEKSTYYVRDAQGNVLSVYEHIIDNQSQNASFAQTEKHIFGSQRGGIEKTFAEMIGAPAVSTTQSSRTLRNKQYELSNHLGNVLVVISDCKLPLDTDNDNTVDGYSADIVSAQDYSPFGVILDNRNWSSSDYRYGFGGHEKIDEVSGSGNTVDMGDRWLDVRLGRTSKPDAHASSYPSVSPYSYALNNPIIYTDPDGKDVILVIWATANGEVGHAGIAVSNYKAVQREVEVRVPAINPGSKGPDGYATTETHIVTEYVPDGTYTYYDNWPDQGVNLGGIKGALKTVDAYRSADIGQNGVIISDISDFTSGNITATYPYDPSTNTGIPGEAHMQDGVVRLETGYETDQQVKATLEGLNQTKPTYNGKGFNCSTYASCGLENVFGEKLGKENVLGPLKSVTPNQLWKDVLKAAGEQGVKADVLVDPGNKVDNSFREGIGQ